MDLVTGVVGVEGERWEEAPPEFEIVNFFGTVETLIAQIAAA